MSSFPRTPRTQRGAIVGLDPFNPVASLVVFQYNPDTMTRTLTPQMSGEGGDRTEALRLKGAPVENIRVEVEIDATDQLAQGDALAGSVGIYPQLSALEMLVYPKTAQVILNAVLMQVGTLEVVPATAPLTLFVWGPKRVLPVKLTEFTITEEAFDPNLNPIRAKVSLGLRVLSYNDLPLTHPGYALFLTHQVVKEAMAVVGSVSGVANASLPR
ncbi:hypothetical protein SAMN05443572_110128 [Myxococcus fulvus]|uniref:Uncharacterized protein n=1 Tax=Myxococcus fulvus TaxID=33 RepID=A0A511T7W4_MYXFU|nr:hypothetical protein [Myxococcus fulvus]AKF85618.1 hypothetical protein MFUL124B02_13980 [Myxococcus fulvus 124B02]GEN10270.1 hypothetical protein MFU01_53070 [Myxococcus fulvus]SEU34804.1 hypothetical protein SAMN05443572_110128 [Myxococcus fulvus]